MRVTSSGVWVDRSALYISVDELPYLSCIYSVTVAFLYDSKMLYGYVSEPSVFILGIYELVNSIIKIQLSRIVNSHLARLLLL